MAHCGCVDLSISPPWSVEVAGESLSTPEGGEHTPAAALFTCHHSTTILPLPISSIARSHIGTMPPLYKRFIPPKPAGSSTPAPAASTEHETPAKQSQDDEPKKRKRERSEEELAERKAKKLRKKGIDPKTSAPPTSTPSSSKSAPAPESETAIEQNDEEATTRAEPEGEFAHIKNAKKRHKLEKEARKARKAEQKAAKESSGEQQVLVDEGRSTSEDVAGADEDARLDGPATETPKPKKRRKEKQRDDAGVQEEVAEDPRDAQDAPPAQLKKRRHKLEHALEQSRQEQPESEEGASPDPEQLRKHGGVLSKFHKSTKLAQEHATDAPQAEQPPVEQPVLRDLESIPIPEKASAIDAVPTDSDLPKWLANPEVVSADSQATFEDMGLDTKVVDHLSALGFTSALPVQQALIPLLLPPETAGKRTPGARFLPGTEPVLPDVAVSAATGSGKTIAYLLPIIEALKQCGTGLGRLRALVVVPTRELVLQVAAVAESLAKGSRVNVGIATGTSKLKDEQDKLIRRWWKYDPEAYEATKKKARRRNYPPDEDDEEFDDYLEELEHDDPREEQRLDDFARHHLIGHVPSYQFTCDILVCTPGRLLEHIDSTLGFGLSFLEWLVLDEADQLLGYEYDGLFETLNTHFTRERAPEEQDAREQLLRKTGQWDELYERRVRKLVLSATMTRDVSKLSGLHLIWPKMVVVRSGDADAEQAVAGASTEIVDGVKNVGDGFELPRGLVEYCVPVGDGSEKPLYLVKLLEDKIMPGDSDPQNPSTSGFTKGRSNIRTRAGSLEMAESDESGDDSDSSSDLSTSSSEPSSESDSESDSDDSSDDSSSEGSSEPEEQAVEQVQSTMHPSRAALLAKPTAPSATENPTVLIFTSTTEAAHRLAHLLKALKPSWSSFITVITKNKPSKSKHRPSNRPVGPPKRPSITISTVRSSRGLDSLAASGRPVTHVIQYDLATSVEGYVHRVGRTARAGRSGEAWTLYRDNQAAWFLREIARAGSVRRAQAVEKVRIDVVDDEELRSRFERGLEGMRELVSSRK
jgi:ATP-dependent RNA helicase DDX51/DBP6